MRTTFPGSEYQRYSRILLLASLILLMHVFIGEPTYAGIGRTVTPSGIGGTRPIPLFGAGQGAGAEKPANGGTESAGGSKPSGENGKTDDSAGGGSTVCEEVVIGPNFPPDPSHPEKKLDASTLAAALNTAGGVSVKAITPDRLLVCGSPANLDVVKRTAQEATGLPHVESAKETHTVRLFFFRRAGDIATAINNSAGLHVKVQAVGDDLLVFPAESEADERAIRELKQWIAMIDVPRSELSVLAWSVQISSTDRTIINEVSNRIRVDVSKYNDKLQDALEQARSYLETRIKEAQAQRGRVFANRFSAYLTGRFTWFPESNKPNSTPEQTCPDGEYCLGYVRIFSEIKPTLSSLLPALIAAQPTIIGSDVLVKQFVDCLESSGCCERDLTDANRKRNEIYLARHNNKPPDPISDVTKTPSDSKEPLTCEMKDEIWDDLTNHPERGPGFECFRDQLQTRLKPENVAPLRKALADFLFQYKVAQFYPQSFVPYYQARSSQTLDTNLDPLIVAFNEDLAVYLRAIQSGLSEIEKGKNVSLASDGIVTVGTISGNASSVETTTQSFFRSPPTVSVRDIVTSAAASQGKVPTFLTGNLSAHAAELLAGAIQAEQRTVANVGRNLNLSVTANTLAGASACEMDVELNSLESDKPSLLNLNDKSSSSDDYVDRVGKHNTHTKVRVDSQKLFEISSFASALVHGRSVPLIPPFLDLPYLGNLARLRLAPGTVYHRSFAIVSAVVIPTAADLANVIDFAADLEPAEVSLIGPPEVTNRPVEREAGGITISLGRPPRKALAAPGIRRHANRVRQRPRRIAPQPEAPPQAQQGTTNTEPPKNQKTGVTHYYWIVTHYIGGAHISGPFEVPDAPRSYDAHHTVTLTWRIPEGAQSFDILRTPTNTRPSGNCQLAVQTGIKPSFLTSTWTDNVASPVNINVPIDVKVFRRINKPPPNLFTFHRHMLDCIAQEARSENGQPPADCGALKLSTTNIE